MPDVLGIHTHYWKVDPPNGTTSTGRCLCGLAQEFINGALPHEAATKLDAVNRKRLGLPPRGRPGPKKRKAPAEASKAWKRNGLSGG